MLSPDLCEAWSLQICLWLLTGLLQACSKPLLPRIELAALCTQLACSMHWTNCTETG